MFLTGRLLSERCIHTDVFDDLMSSHLTRYRLSVHYKTLQYHCAHSRYWLQTVKLNIFYHNYRKINNAWSSKLHCLDLNYVRRVIINHRVWLVTLRSGFSDHLLGINSFISSTKTFLSRHYLLMVPSFVLANGWYRVHGTRSTGTVDIVVSVNALNSVGFVSSVAMIYFRWPWWEIGCISDWSTNLQSILDD
jgi:hypothetical protein